MRAGKLSNAEWYYLATPKSSKGKGVLVLHAWWGLNPFFKKFCDRLAKAGFVALAPDLYEGKIATTIEQAKRLRSSPKKEPPDKTILRAIDVLTHHASVEDSFIGVVGFSMGGHWACWLAQRPNLPIRATVTFYAARGGNYSHSRSAFQCHFAETDKWVSAASSKALAKALGAARRTAEFYTYPDTTHWFIESDRPEAYDARAAKLAWRRTIEFLKKHV